MNYLDGKVIVITGAGSGFGRLVAEMTAARGARVVAADIDEVAVRDVVEGIVATGGAATHRRADVTLRSEINELAAFAVDTFGALDVMVNNAGVMPLAFFSDHALAADAWDRCIDINFRGVLNGITAVYDQMITQGRGQIVNISSIYGNFPNAGAAVYGATKAAVNVLSDALRMESQGKIKVTTVRPTGVPGTGLGAGVLNLDALVGILGANTASYMDSIVAHMSGTLPDALADVDRVTYWTISPEQLAEQVVYVIDQPWGVSISDITVRASGEEFIL